MIPGGVAFAKTNGYVDTNRMVMSLDIKAPSECHTPISYDAASRSPNTVVRAMG